MSSNFITNTGVTKVTIVQQIWRVDDREPSQRGVTACIERK